MQNQAIRKIKQRGLTLIEVIVALGIGALVIGGALSLYASASSSQYGTQLNSDLSAVRSSVKSLYSGQGGYGVGSLNSVLITGNKVPTTMSVSGTTIRHQQNGTLSVDGNTSNFTMTVTNIPTDVCVNLVSSANGFVSVQVGSNTANTTFPISPTIAASQCGSATTQTIVFTSA